MTIGEKIREARRSKNLTQKQLGELAGIAEPTIRRYELGKLNPKRETLKKIADALDVHPAQLSTELLDEALLEMLKRDYASEGEFQAAFWGKRVSFAVLTEENDKRLFQFYDMLNEEGQREAVDAVFDLTENKKYLKDIYTKTPQELRELQQDNKYPPYPPSENK